jgi:hypothetical protein
LGGHRPGERLNIRYQHHGEDKATVILLQESPALSAIPYERAGKPVTDAILQFRKSWLGAK